MSYKQQNQFLDFFALHGVTHTNFAVLSSDKKMKGDARERGRAESEKSMGWAWHENARGGDVYIRPARTINDEPQAWRMVFLDDLGADAAAAVSARCGALIVCTSPGLHHAWIPTSRPLDERERAAVQRQLAGEFGGDPASISGEHFGRMPGYKNQKRGGCWVNIISESSLPPLIVGDVPLPDDETGGGSQTTARAARAASQVTGGGGVDDSESGREFGWALGRMAWALRAGCFDDEMPKIRQKLAEQAAARGKKNPAQYAEITARNAAQQIGLPI